MPNDTIKIALHFIYNPNYVNPPFPNVNGGGSYLPCDDGVGNMPNAVHPCPSLYNGSMRYRNAYHYAAQIMLSINKNNGENSHPNILPPGFGVYSHSPQRKFVFELIKKNEHDLPFQYNSPSCAIYSYINLTNEEQAALGGWPHEIGIFFHLDPAYDPNNPDSQTRGHYISTNLNTLENAFGIPEVHDVFYIPSTRDPNSPQDEECEKYGGLANGIPAPNEASIAGGHWANNNDGSAAAKTIVHESGHCQGLYHYFDHYFENQNLSDVYHAYCQRRHWDCAAQNACNNANCINNNNVMSYSKDATTGFTSDQLSKALYYNEHMGLTTLKKSFCARPKAPHYSQPYDMQVYDSDVVWRDSKTLYGNLYIKRNAKLTIRCRVHMPENANIIVEPGGTLVVDGGYLTNIAKYGQSDICPDNMWNGIQVWGNKDRPQMLPHQGLLIMKNGAFIEHARIAVLAGRLDYLWYTDGSDFNESFDPSYAGGIVQIEETVFNNNRFCIKIEPYTPTQSQLNFIKNCRFVADELLKDQRSLPFSYLGKTTKDFVTCLMDDVEISGNSFEVSPALYQNPNIEVTGVIVAICSGKVINNRFDGCAKAIEYWSLGGKRFEATDNVVAHCRRNGIRITGGADRYRLTGNVINPETTSYDDVAATRKGIFLDGSFGGGPVNRNVIAGCKVGLWAQGVVNFDYSSTFTPPDVVKNRFKHSWRGLQTDPTFNAVNVLGLDCNVFESYRSAAWVNRAKFYGYAQNQFPDIISENRLGSADRPVNNLFNGNGTDVCSENPIGGGHNPVLDLDYHYSPLIPQSERPATTCNNRPHIGIVNLLEGSGGYSNPECLGEVPNGMPTADNDPSEVLDMMATVSSELRAGIAQIYNSALADAAKWTEMRTFVSLIPDGFARYWEAELAIADDNFARARTALNAAPEIGEDSGLFKAWLNLKLNLAESGRVIPQATPAEVAFVENQLLNSPFSGVAKTFLRFYDGRVYEPLFSPYPDSAQARIAAPAPEEARSFAIYPNPAQSEMTIVRSADEDFTLEIRSADGRIAMTPMKMGRKENTLNLSELSPGLYIVVVRTDSGIIHRKTLVKIP
jgi:hypothetical protein